MDLIICIAMDEGVNLNVINNIVQDLGNEMPGHEEIKRRNARIRNENYFEMTIPRYTDIQFLEHFRMSRHTFQVHIYIHTHVHTRAHTYIHQNRYMYAYDVLIIQ